VCISSAASRTSRVMGPMPHCGAENGHAPLGTRPWLGSRPKMPLKADGLRIEPPSSVPMDKAPNPAATATADPPLEPPELRVLSQGFTASRVSRLSERMLLENSGILV